MSEQSGHTELAGSSCSRLLTPFPLLCLAFPAVPSPVRHSGFQTLKVEVRWPTVDREDRWLITALGIVQNENPRAPSSCVSTVLSSLWDLGGRGESCGVALSPPWPLLCL